MRILIADDHELVREGVRSVLGNRPDFEVCGYAIDGRDAIQKAQKLNPDAIVMDISMPKLNGLDAIRELRRTLPDIKILVLTQHHSPEMMRQARNAGARGYVLKSAISADLVTAIDQVLQGQLVFDDAAIKSDSGNRDFPEAVQRSAAFEADRKQSDRAMSLLAAIVDSSDDAIVSKSLDGVITSWNKGAERLFGYTAEEAVGKHITLIIPTDRREEESEILSRLRRGERIDHFETIRRRKDGTLLNISATISPVKDEAGRVVGASKVARDITEAKRTQEALRQNEERFRALSQRLETQVHNRTRELEQKNADILKTAEQVRQLSWRLLTTQDEERRHIARELHDSAGQILTVLGMSLATLVQNAKQKAPELAESAEEARELVQQLTKEIRTTSYLLHPPLLEESGLPAALSWYIRGLIERSGLDIDFTISQEFGRLPRDMELVVFRVVQECLTNIHRHSGSKNAFIKIVREPDRVLVEVRDQGKGISRERRAEIHSNGVGVGIRGMRERLRQYRGEMIIDSNPAGTTVMVTIPLSQEQVAGTRGAVSAEDSEQSNSLI
jgi:PAS domain S-box-containing protein